MRITVFGAGALGSLVGGLLSRHNQVILVGRREHVDAVNRRGLRISGSIETTIWLSARTDAASIGPQDMVLVTVKAYDTETAAGSIAPLVGDGTIVVSLQNGLNNLPILKGRFGRRVVGGVTSCGVTYVSPGHVRYAGAGETIFGSLGETSEGARQVCDVFSRSGIESRTTKDLMAEVWLKAIINAAINPITALLGERNRCIEDDPDLTDLARDICLEAEAAARASGVELPSKDPFLKVMEVVAYTRENESSMLQDVRRGRRTEIDDITGAIVSVAKSGGIATPLNEALWKLVRHLSMRG